MNAQVSSILYPVQDTESAKALFTALLGQQPMADSEYYVGYDVNGLQIGLVPGGFDDGVTGPLPYFTVENVEQSVASLEASGATIVSPIKDIGPGGIIAVLRDTEGNHLGLIQPPAQ